MTLATILEALTTFLGLVRRFDQGDAHARLGLKIPAALAKVLTLSEGLACATL
jgi:hypothetical protein